MNGHIEIALLTYEQAVNHRSELIRQYTTYKEREGQELSQSTKVALLTRIEFVNDHLRKLNEVVGDHQRKHRDGMVNVGWWYFIASLVVIVIIIGSILYYEWQG